MVVNAVVVITATAPAARNALDLLVGELVTLLLGERNQLLRENCMP
jgi:hypothetical protein